ncbi:TIGR01777 family protein [Marinilabiliaceae bacterium JC017]|nr:TIGR01777 family protein [Marinilabiliaceae bacterium JC017]
MAISGVSGFIGSELAHFLEAKGFEIVPITRKLFDLPAKMLAFHLNGIEGLYHLAGAPVLKRWTKAWKKEIRESRILTTRKLVDAISLMPVKPKFVFSASAVGIYDPYEVHDEFSTCFANDFLGSVCLDWEKEILKLQGQDLRLVIGRFGLVFDKKRGIYARLIKPFKVGLGGYVGMGHQAFPFIHIKDLLNALWFVLDKDKINGVYNFVAPQMISNVEFTKMLAEKMNRPSFMKVPEWLIRLVFGEGAEILVKGQKVLPARLLKQGFDFRFPVMSDVLDDLLKKE